MRLPPLVCAVFLILPGSVSAALAPSEAGRAAFGAFKGLDTDSDRRLTRAELLGRGKENAADALFRLLDADGDRRLSVAEAQAAGGGPMLGRFQAYDANKDQTVTRREFPIAFDPVLFDALDRDRDGALMLGEVRPAFAGWRPREKAEPPPARARKAEPQPLCWVPAIGDDGWGLEMPVVTTGRGCRTSP